MPSELSVVLWLYARPEFSWINISRLSQNHDISRLYIVHDGLRKDASNIERNSHQQVRRLILSQHFPPKVDVLTFEDNVDLTNHFFRVARVVLENCESFVNHEDDKISNKEIFRLFSEVEVDKNLPQFFDTRNLQVHQWKDSVWRRALYSINGVNLMNRSLVDSAENDFRTKVFDSQAIKKTIEEFYNQILFKKSDIGRVVSRLAEIISWGLTNPNRPDSLINYTLLSRKQLKHVTNLNLSHDLSAIDFRGANQEYLEKEDLQICYDVTLRKTDMGAICENCEIEGIKSRVPLGFQSRAKAYLSFYLDWFTGMGSGPKAQAKKTKSKAQEFSSDQLLKYLSMNFLDHSYYLINVYN